MENIHLNEVSEIIHCAVVFPKKTIRFISERTDISRDIIRHVLLYFYEYPFGGIAICCEGLHRSADPFTIDCNILDDIALWSVDTSRMDRIPVENLNSDEALILLGLLNGLSSIDLNEVTLRYQYLNKVSCMMTKGIDQNTGKLFDFKQYPMIKKALIDRLLLKVKSCEDCDKIITELKPLGIVYQSEEDKWYLIGFDVNERIISYDIEVIERVHIGPKFSMPKQFDLESHLQAYFSLENGEEEIVEVIFLDEANVLEKAQRRLQGKGCFVPLEDGSLLFTGGIIGLRGFKDWILGFGSSVVVRKPETLRLEIIKELQEIVLNYGSSNEQVSAAVER